jgi:hypothetical protein
MLRQGGVSEGARRATEDTPPCRAPTIGEVCSDRPREPDGDDKAVRSAVKRARQEERARHRPDPQSSHRYRAPHRAEARVQGEYFTSGLFLSIAHWRDGNRQWKPPADSSCAIAAAPRSSSAAAATGARSIAPLAARRPHARSVQEAGHRYQKSRRGRLKHAERSRRYRLRQQNVTHQGSMSLAQSDLLAANSAVGREPAAAGLPATRRTACCHFCGTRCSGLLRQGFLGSCRVPSAISPDRRGTRLDHFP